MDDPSKTNEKKALKREFFYKMEKNYIGCSFKKNELNFYKIIYIFLWVLKEELPKK